MNGDFPFEFTSPHIMSPPNEEQLKLVFKPTHVERDPSRPGRTKVIYNRFPKGIKNASVGYTKP
jgi:hypothetical protein